jgi:hypothetical protein
MQFHDPPKWSRNIPADRLVISMQSHKPKEEKEEAPKIRQQ